METTGSSDTLTAAVEIPEAVEMEENEEEPVDAVCEAVVEVSASLPEEAKDVTTNESLDVFTQQVDTNATEEPLLSDSPMVTVSKRGRSNKRPRDEE